MSDKSLHWQGSSLKDIKNDDVFTLDARKEDGYQLSQVQNTLIDNPNMRFDLYNFIDIKCNEKADILFIRKQSLVNPALMVMSILEKEKQLFSEK